MCVLRMLPICYIHTTYRTNLALSYCIGHSQLFFKYITYTTPVSAPSTSPPTLHGEGGGTMIIGVGEGGT